MKIINLLSLMLMAQPALSASAPQSDPISLIALNVPAQALIQAIADSRQLNIVMPPGRSVGITLHLEKVTWQQALNAIGESVGLEWQQRAGIIVFHPAGFKANQQKSLASSRRAEAPKITEIFRLHHVAARELADLIQSHVLPADSSPPDIIADPRTNRLLVTATRAGIARLRHWVAQLDVPVGQIELAAWIVTMNDHSLDALGVKWHRAGHAAPGETGLDINLSAKDATSWAGFNIAHIGSHALGLALSALEQKNQLEIIASPRLLAAHQQPASIKQGSEIPYQVSQGDRGRNSVEFKDAVLGMEVTPEILAGKRVRLKLRITQNMPGQKLKQAEGEVLTIDKQEIETQVIVGHGETLALGGIFQDKRHHNSDAVPWLGRLPLLGGLFRYQGKENERRELVVFITPHIVNSQ